MIGFLPKTLEIDGREYEIRTDFRVVLTIFEAFGDPELTENEKAIVLLKCLYKEVPKDLQQAAEKALQFINGGNCEEDPRGTDVKLQIKLLDWEQDEQLIFSAINKTAGFEVRSMEYLHWYTFLGYFNEIGEGLLSTVINIRSKKARGKKLEKHELEFYREHKSLIDIKRKYSAEERVELDRLNDIFK